MYVSDAAALNVTCAFGSIERWIPFTFCDDTCRCVYFIREKLIAIGAARCVNLIDFTAQHLYFLM